MFKGKVKDKEEAVIPKRENRPDSPDLSVNGRPLTKWPGELDVFVQPEAGKKVS